jgi:hypothetical protein
MKLWKKINKKLAKTEKIARKKTRIKFDRKKPKEDEIVKKKQSRKWSQTKKIGTKFERLKMVGLGENKNICNLINYSKFKK